MRTPWSDGSSASEGSTTSWTSQGFIVMIRPSPGRTGGASAAHVAPGRRASDTRIFVHLMEVLHRAGSGSKARHGGLLKWLAQQRDPTTPRLEEHQLRMESDERRSSSVTVHKSKGLGVPGSLLPACTGTAPGSGIAASLWPSQRPDAGLTLDMGPTTGNPPAHG